MIAAIGPPCHCPVPRPRSNSGRIAARITTSCVSGSALTTIRFGKSMNAGMGEALLKFVLAERRAGHGVTTSLPEHLPALQAHQRFRCALQRKDLVDDGLQLSCPHQV